MTTTSSNFPNRPFRLEQRSSIYSQTAWNGGNSNLVHSELWIIKNSHSPSWAVSGNSASMYVNGALVGSTGNFGFDFRNSDQLLVLAQDNWFGADGAGNMGVNISGYANVQLLGNTEVHSSFGAARIPRPPSAPTPSGLTQITANSMQYQFNGNDNGGSGILEWQLEYSTNGFASWTSQGSSGTSTVTGLPPATNIQFRSRGRNAYGWGAYSSVISATTLSSVRVSNGSSWLTPQVLVSNGSTWKSPTIYYSKAGAWLAPLS